MEKDEREIEIYKETEIRERWRKMRETERDRNRQR